ncbi:MAG: NusG domain II-containing protein [Candidatus Aegiribacteria sp.]|nr:NusG domain II-containing protein [Candidatus Aegiribacteria sp.]
MKSDKKYPFFRINDLAIPVVLFLLLQSFHGGGEETSECRLEVHTAESILRYELGVDSIFTVMGNLGEMEINIENEMARISRSPCPGQDCVRQSWLSKPGDLAVCVPSGVFIVIASEDDSLSPDAVSY